MEGIKMSIFNQRIKRGIEDYKENLKPKNGNTHILLIETIVDVEYKQKQEYMTKINDLLDFMQERNYEIVDIKLEINEQRSLAGYLYETMIIYK